MDTTVLGLYPEQAKEKPYIASMGIYVCKASALNEHIYTYLKVERIGFRPRVTPLRENEKDAAHEEERVGHIPPPPAPCHRPSSPPDR